MYEDLFEPPSQNLPSLFLIISPNAWRVSEVPLGTFWLHRWALCFTDAFRAHMGVDLGCLSVLMIQ